MPSLVTPASTPTCANTTPGSRKPCGADRSRRGRTSPAHMLPKTLPLPLKTQPPAPPPSDPQHPDHDPWLRTPLSQSSSFKGSPCTPTPSPSLSRVPLRHQSRHMNTKALNWHHIPKRIIFKALNVSKSQTNTINKILTILQGPTVYHRGLCSMLCGSLDGRGVWERKDTCV